MADNKFTFTWYIHNFGACAVKENGFLKSPIFEVDFMKETKLYLRIYPRGNKVPGFISVYLFKEQIDNKTFLFRLSIGNSSGVFKEIFKDNFKIKEISWGNQKFFSIDQLKAGNYLNSDIMILRCQVSQENVELPGLMCYAHTIIKTHKLDYVWKLDNFVDSNSHILNCMNNQTAQITNFSSDIPSFEMNISNLNDNDAINFSIQNLVGNNTFLLTYFISLLDAKERVAHSFRGQRLFEESTAKQIWDFSFMSKRKLLSNQKLLLPSGRLTLRCEFSISTNEYEVIKFGYGESSIAAFKASSLNQISDKPSRTLELEDALWKDNLKRIYNEGELSDVTIHTPKRQFPVHKCVLCAHSEVFRAMLNNDTKEQNTGVIEIDDLDTDTVDKMLAYLYTGEVDDLECSVAQKLYFAADKYSLDPLLKKCSNYLMEHLDVSNVCDVLVLADTHQDQELKQYAMDFVVEHDSEVVDSENWDTVMETHPHLSLVTMKRIICKK